MDQHRHLFKGIQRLTSLTKTITSFVFCGLVFCTTACSSDDDNGTTPYSDDLQELIQISANTVTSEFIHNYYSLRYNYIDQNKYLGAPENYIGKADIQAMLDKHIPWDYFNIYYMYNQMNDPYTYYLDPSRSLTWLNQLVNATELVDNGFTLDSSYLPAGKYVIESVAKKSPAEKAGLKSGDEIIAIEGVPPTNDIAFNRLTTANEGDIINFTIKRDSITRNISYVISTYNESMVNLTFKDSIPIITIHEFQSQTSSDSGTFGEFIGFLRETEKYKSTIIDLRDNGGGDIDQCIAMSQALLAKGDTIIRMDTTKADSIHKKQIMETTYPISTENGIGKDRYFVFLANGNTASCSEIMIASITSNKKSPVVGSTTYGKGIGQRFRLTPSLGLNSITSFRFFDKNDGNYHKYGIEPDFPINDRSSALEKAIELAKAKNFTRTAGYGTQNTGHFAKIGSSEPDTMPGSYLLPEEYRKKF